MSWQPKWLAAGLAAAMITVVPCAKARRPASCSTVTRSNLVSCAVEASFERRAALAAVDAAEGRVAATDPWLPSSPTLSLTGARREGAEGTVLNWSASLGIELEVAGQRGARRRAASAERDADEKSVAAIERATAADAWRSYFEALAAREGRRVVERLETAAKQVWESARAAAGAGVAAGVEADLAEATYVRAIQRRVEAARNERIALGSLALVMGLDGDEPVAVLGGLDPLPAPRHLPAKLPDRPEASALQAQSQALSARADAQRRSRVPNPTLSAFIQNDGFNERVLGVGLSFPLPLPEPLGRMSSGDIAESEALARRAALLAAGSRRAARADLARASAAYRAASEAARAYTEERLSRAETTLASVASQVAAGRIAIRDAVLLQEPLFELLLGAVEARRILCLASVEVARAVGRGLAEGARR